MSGHDPGGSRRHGGQPRAIGLHLVILALCTVYACLSTWTPLRTTRPSAWGHTPESVGLCVVRGVRGGRGSVLKPPHVIRYRVGLGLLILIHESAYERCWLGGHVDPVFPKKIERVQQRIVGWRNLRRRTQRQLVATRRQSGLPARSGMLMSHLLLLLLHVLLLHVLLLLLLLMLLLLVLLLLVLLLVLLLLLLLVLLLLLLLLLLVLLLLHVLHIAVYTLSLWRRVGVARCRRSRTRPTHIHVRSLALHGIPHTLLCRVSASESLNLLWSPVAS